MLREAKTAWSRGAFVEMDTRTLAFREQSFHALWSNVSFVHIPETQALNVLNVMKRVLKDQTAFLFINVEIRYDVRIESAA